MKGVTRYKVAKNPKTKLWYVVGWAGGIYMQVSDGFKLKGDATKQMKRYIGADISAKQELRGWSGGL